MSVCVCGNVVFDILVRPVEQLRWAATTLVETVSQQLGGNAGSTSYTLGKLGIPTFIVTLTGRDDAASAVTARLQSAGVDTSRIMAVDAPTSVAISLVNPTGERACSINSAPPRNPFHRFRSPARLISIWLPSSA